MGCDKRGSVIQIVIGSAEVRIELVVCEPDFDRSINRRLGSGQDQWGHWGQMEELPAWRRTGPFPGRIIGTRIGKR